MSKGGATQAGEGRVAIMAARWAKLRPSAASGKRLKRAVREIGVETNPSLHDLC